MAYHPGYRPAYGAPYASGQVAAPRPGVNGMQPTTMGAFTGPSYQQPLPTNRVSTLPTAQTSAPTWQTPNAHNSSSSADRRSPNSAMQPSWQTPNAHHSSSSADRRSPNSAMQPSWQTPNAHNPSSIADRRSPNSAMQPSWQTPNAHNSSSSADRRSPSSAMQPASRNDRSVSDGKQVKSPAFQVPAPSSASPSPTSEDSSRRYGARDRAQTARPASHPSQLYGNSANRGTSQRRNNPFDEAPQIDRTTLTQQQTAAPSYSILSKAKQIYENGSSPAITPLPPGPRGYTWIREDNSAECRSMRREAAVATLCKGLSLPSRNNMVACTKFVPDVHCTVANGRSSNLQIHRYEGNAVSAAVLCAGRTEGVAVVSAASAFQVGGGFLSGGRHALEEALCMQSTLFFSLQKAAEQRGLNCEDPGHNQYIHEHEAVLSPGVEVFRDGSDKGYAPIRSVKLAAIISIAMPNMNPRVNHTPTWRGGDSEYERVIEQKFKAVLAAAREAGTQVLVMPDVGCGVFRNDPRTVGKTFGRVLSEFGGNIKQVILAGGAEFCEAVDIQYRTR